jgi:hypothetical protein
VTAYEPDPANAHVHRLTVAANADPGDIGVVTVPAHDVLARAGDVDFLKLDIEGAEWALLEDPRFAEMPARLVALEYHQARCPSDDARDTAVASLERAGYQVELGDLVATPGHGMVWGWRTA